MSTDNLVWTVKDGNDVPDDVKVQVLAIDSAEIRGEPVHWPVAPTAQDGEMGLEVALVDDNLAIGFLVYEYQPRLGVLELRRMAVKQCFQRQGVCRSMIDCALGVLAMRHQVKATIACVNEYWLDAQLALRAMGFFKELETENRHGMPDLYWFGRKEQPHDCVET